jgi:hypothetical protein
MNAETGAIGKKERKKLWSSTSSPFVSGETGSMRNSNACLVGSPTACICVQDIAHLQAPLHRAIQSFRYVPAHCATAPHQLKVTGLGWISFSRVLGRRIRRIGLCYQRVCTLGPSRVLFCTVRISLLFSPSTVSLSLHRHSRLFLFFFFAVKGFGCVTKPKKNWNASDLICKIR